MNYQQIDLSKVKYEVIADPAHVKMTYGGNKFVINTPEMTVPFGIDSVYGKYYFKLQFDDYKENIEMDGFFNTLMLVEQHMEIFIEDHIEGDNVLNCEFNFKDKFEPSINVKLASYGKKIQTKIVSSSGSELNYWDVKKGSKVKCKMELSDIWKIKDKFYYKWNVLQLNIVS